MTLWMILKSVTDFYWPCPAISRVAFATKKSPTEKVRKGHFLSCWRCPSQIPPSPRRCRADWCCPRHQSLNRSNSSKDLKLKTICDMNVSTAYRRPWKNPRLWVQDWKCEWVGIWKFGQVATIPLEKAQDSLLEWSTWGLYLITSFSMSKLYFLSVYKHQKLPQATIVSCDIIST